MNTQSGVTPPTPPTTIRSHLEAALARSGTCIYGDVHPHIEAALAILDNADVFYPTKAYGESDAIHRLVPDPSEPTP